MSVLIEALTLVVPKRVLDVSYPGGTDAFLEAMLHLESPPRFVCNADPDLVNISFYDGDHLKPAVDLLESHNVIGVDAKTNQMVEMAWVDQRYGPVLPCPWLAWRVHLSGFTYAWLASAADPGDMAAPEDWTLQQSRDLTRSDRRDDPDMFRLSTRDGIDTWLDLSSGDISMGVARPLDDQSRSERRQLDD